LAQVGLDPAIREDDAPATREASREPQMTHCQKVFEAIMRTKGHDDFEMNTKGKYLVPALQTRWSYFQLGWEMKEVTA
jgi:hypothetical protein